MLFLELKKIEYKSIKINAFSEFFKTSSNSRVIILICLKTSEQLKDIF